MQKQKNRQDLRESVMGNELEKLRQKNEVKQRLLEFKQLDRKNRQQRWKEIQNMRLYCKQSKDLMKYSVVDSIMDKKLARQNDMEEENRKNIKFLKKGLI